MNEHTYKSGEQEQPRELDLSSHALTLLDNLTAARDVDGLNALRDILAELTLNGIADSKTSLVDLAELAESIAVEISRDGDPTENEVIIRHRNLIQEDVNRQ